MRESYRLEMAEILKQMQPLRREGGAQARRVERLERMAWADDLAALEAVWCRAPALAERYLDVLTSVLHEVPDGAGAIEPNRPGPRARRQSLPAAKARSRGRRGGRSTRHRSAS